MKGVLFCAKHAIPHMKKAGGGSIINLSSIYALVGAPDRRTTQDDVLRWAAKSAKTKGMAPIFFGFNHGKQSIALDLKQPEDNAVIKALLAMGLPPVAAWGSDEVKARVIPPVLRGEQIAALAISEPGGSLPMLTVRCAPRVREPPTRGCSAASAWKPRRATRWAR